MQQPTAAPVTEQTASITLTFRVTDEALLTRLSDKAISEHGMGVEIDADAPIASRIVEMLLHSNPAIGAYLDYGIEFVSEDLKDGVA